MDGPHMCIRTKKLVYKNAHTSQAASAKIIKTFHLRNYSHTWSILVHISVVRILL